MANLGYQCSVCEVFPPVDGFVRISRAIRVKDLCIETVVVCFDCYDKPSSALREKRSHCYGCGVELHGKLGNAMTEAKKNHNLIVSCVSCSNNPALTAEIKCQLCHRSLDGRYLELDSDRYSVRTLRGYTGLWKGTVLCVLYEVD